MPCAGPRRRAHSYTKEPKSGRYSIRTSWIGSTGGLGLGNLGFKNAVAAATYDALAKVPEADLMLPLTTMTRKDGFGCPFFCKSG